MGVLRGPPGIQHMENRSWGVGGTMPWAPRGMPFEEKATINNQGNFSKSSVHECLIKEDSELVIKIFFL